MREIIKLVTAIGLLQWSLASPRTNFRPFALDVVRKSFVPTSAFRIIERVETDRGSMLLKTCVNVNQSNGGEFSTETFETFHNASIAG